MTTIHQLSAGAESTALLGGKGNALAALTRAGFRVPAGFVLTTEATAELSGGAWPADLEAAFVAAYDNLSDAGTVPVAVRSSATGEDAADASFAGQHETILDVEGSEAARAAVLRCLASLDSESATVYRDLASADSEAAMAIVVQRMVPAVAAGVAFTDDPTGRSPGHVVVEAVAGYGELLVSGLAQAESIVVSGGGAVVQRESPGEPVLTDAQAREVAAVALQCRELFGGEQDIEYAFDGDGQLWLLQSRPITTSAPTTGGWYSEFDTPTDGDEVWTSANVQEVLPGLLTPLSMSSGSRSTQAAFVEGYRELGLIGKDESPPWIAFFYNRAYLNVGTTRKLGSRALGSNGDSVEIQYLGGETFGDLPQETLRTRLPFILKSLLPLGKLLFTARARTERYEREVRQAERERFALAMDELPDTELRRLILKSEAINARVFAHHLQVSGLASAAYTNLERLLKSRIGPERTEEAIPALLSGLKNVESARIGIDIWNLSRVALNTGIAGVIREDSIDPGADELPPAWRAAYRSFMRAHGHRGMREMEASTRTWRKDPAPVMATVRGYLGIDPEHSPIATLERQEEERIALTSQLRAEVGLFVRPLFRRFLADAQDLVAQRERTKSIIVRGARMLDPVLDECAHRFVARRIIADGDDVYFLSFEDVLTILEGRAAGSSYAEAVARRRKEMERNRYIELPERFTGHPEPLPPTADSDATVLRGTPVSKGSVTARARVIRDPAIDETIQPGEILVAPGDGRRLDTALRACHGARGRHWQRPQPRQHDCA